MIELIVLKQTTINEHILVQNSVAGTRRMADMELRMAMRLCYERTVYAAEWTVYIRHGTENGSETVL